MQYSTKLHNVKSTYIDLYQTISCDAT